MSWARFYEGRLLCPEYRAYAARRYTPFIKRVISHIKNGDRVVEIGCGLATITSIIAEMPWHRVTLGCDRPSFCGFHCYDVCPHMVEYARTNLCEGYPVDLGDARLPTGCNPDVVHSHGMLEHMNDNDIRAVIAASRADGARVAVHYVPGDKYEKPSFGDERLMPLSEWQRIAEPTTAFTFNDGYDYVLEWDFTK